MDVMHWGHGIHMVNRPGEVYWRHNNLRNVYERVYGQPAFTFNSADVNCSSCIEIIANEVADQLLPEDPEPAF